MSEPFGSFSTLKDQHEAALPSVCLVTSELVGPFKNGGLGTSMTGLVELLGAKGADTTVIYTGEVIGDLGVWREKYKTAGIRLETLQDFPQPTLIGPLQRIGWTNAWLVYLALKDRSFDVVHFNDTLGEGSFCLMAKRMGLAFSKTLLTLALHSPTEWILESNGHPANWMGFACFTTGERLSIANADLLWGPSLYLLRWITDRGYALPQKVVNQQYVIPTGTLFEAGTEKIDRVAVPPSKLPKQTPKEIVFFGRLEERKGIRLFINAITKLGPELARRGVSVLFMGKSSSVNGIDAATYLEKRSSQWPFSWRIESGFDQQQAVAYLRNRPCVAVMASPVDNSPCTVYEALQFGLPFIAARTGGIPELISAEDHERHLFDYTVASLSSLILRTLEEGISNAAPAVSVKENQRRWLAMHQNWQNFLPAPHERPAAQEQSFVVMVDHASDGAALQRTLGSIRAVLADGCRNIIIHARDMAELPSDLDLSIEIVDELSDKTGADILGDMLGSSASVGLMLRSGIALEPSARETLGRAAVSGADLAIPMAKLADTGAVMPLFQASAALTAIEGDFDSGGLAFCVATLPVRLAGNISRLNRASPYLGLIENVHGAGGKVWPIPAVLFQAVVPEDLVLNVSSSEARRSLALSRMPNNDLYQALSVGRSHYRMVWPPTPPQPPSPVAAAVVSAIMSVPGVQNPEAQAFVKKTLVAVLGDRAAPVIARIKGILRGG